MASVNFEDQVRIPLGLMALDDFRRWSHASDFPPNGRIDFVGDDIEVDMSPEDLFAHGTLKGKIYSTLLEIVEQRDLGHLFTDSTRICNATAAISAEPDILFISHESLDTDRVSLVPKASGEPDRFVEIEGSPDLIIEIVSDSSFQKDRQRLWKAYFQAGVTEYWIVDARQDPLWFQLNQAGDSEFEPVVDDKDGFLASGVFGCRFRIDRNRSPRGYWRYDVRRLAK